MLALCRLGCVAGSSQQQALPAAAAALLGSVSSSAALPPAAVLPATGTQLHATSIGSRTFCSSRSSSSSSSQQADTTRETQPAADASSSTTTTTTKLHRQQQQYRALPPRELAQLRAAIFEQHVGDGRRSGRKALLRPLKGRHIADWYFTLTHPEPGLQPDDLEEERVFKTQLARATGGGPPKKGQGKRSKK